MMQATRSRIGHPAWLGLSLVVGLPALAEAQLFPNRTITRERQPCATEPPFYSTVRRNYFGYYPTCWSKFPDGWGCPCPNPELPNRAAAFAAQPRDPFEKPLPEDDMDLPADDFGPNNPRGMDNSELPPVPNPGQRSPFPAELSPNDNGGTLRTPDPSLPPRGTNPGGRSGIRPGAGSGTGPGSGANNGLDPNTGAVNRPAATTALLEMPHISAPASAAVVATSTGEPTPNAGNITLAPDATLTSTGTAGLPDLGPLPGTPAASNSVPPESVIDPALLGGSTRAATPAQAPQRKGILSGLFNSSKRRR